MGLLTRDPVTEAVERRGEEMNETHHPEVWFTPPCGKVRYRVYWQQHGVPGVIAAGVRSGPSGTASGRLADAHAPKDCNNVHLEQSFC